jgi:hypothetical protein
MQFSAVESRLSNIGSGSFLRKFVLLQRATYLNRYKWLINSYGGNHKMALIGLENPSCLQTSIAVASEVNVMLDYIRSSPLYRMGLTENELARLFNNF